MKRLLNTENTEDVEFARFSAANSVCLSFCLLICLLVFGKTALAGEFQEQLPYPSSAVFLLGWGDIDNLQLKTSSRSIDIIREPESGYSSPHYPSISRDGKTVACIRSKSRKPQRVSVATFSVAEEKWIDYAESDFVDAVAISPDSLKLAFLIHDSDNTAIRLKVMDIKSRETLTLPANEPSGPLSWAPDGKRIVYQSGDTSVGVLDIDSGKSTYIANARRPSWAPSGNWIAYVNKILTQLVVSRPDGSEPRVLLSLREGKIIYSGSIDMPPVWSPDSSQIIVNVIRTEGKPPRISVLDLAAHKPGRDLKSNIPILGWALTH